MTASVACRRAPAALALICLALAYSCGGHLGVSAPSGTAADNSLTRDLARQWPGHSWNGGAKSGSYIAVAVDSTERNLTPLTGRLRLAVEEKPSGELVRIYGRDIADSHAYLHLKYDAAAVHPAETQPGKGLDDTTLFLGIATQPGVVTLGATTIGGVALPGGELELAQVRFARGAMLAPRTASKVCTVAVTDLSFTSGATLGWTYKVTGDYDQNSEVNISDITPIGVNFLKKSTDAGWQSAQVADGDKNGLVNISDLTPVGAHYLERCTDYQVQAGPAATGPFAEVTGGDVAQTTGTTPTGGGFKTYSFTVPSPVLNSYYVVVDADGGTTGAQSNAVQYTGGASNPAPTNLAATDDGTTITLTWTAPVGGTPDGYNAYVSSASDMTGAVEMNSGLISGTTYPCPLAVTVGTPHYFAVKAAYGANLSAYSNIYGYLTGGGVNPPTGLTATKNGTQIDLAWTAASSVDGYNAYVSPNPDMSGQSLMNLGLIAPGTMTAYTCPIAVDASVEHYFALKSSSGGTESNYSNIFHYVPGGGPDTIPPVWQGGGTGIKSATPGDTTVTVTWYTAVDAQTPPVQYLIYYALDSGAIDYTNPAAVVPSTQSSYPVLGLTNGSQYQFAVRAEDSVAPTPNVDSNTTTLLAVPGPYPADGAVGSLTSSDTASVHITGEEVPRIVSVNHGATLEYSHWDGTAWQSVDLNTTIGDASRKYHPQLIAIGDVVHVAFATPTAVYEFFGSKDADPSTWALKTVATGFTAVYGTGFAYDSTNNYFAMVWACASGSESLQYSDRDAAGDWVAPSTVMSGSPQVWQCDLAINSTTGDQWAVASNGMADSTADNLHFWYNHRANRGAAWDFPTGQDTTYGGDVMTVKIDPATGNPVVLDAEVRNVDVLGNAQPVSDATVFNWNGTNWTKNVLEQGSANFDGQQFLDVQLTGQDPVLGFSPSGKTIAVWTFLDFNTDIVQDQATLTGSLQTALKTGNSWGTPSALATFIPSSTSLAVGSSFQHYVTCNLGLSDSDTAENLSAKYSTRNDYVEGQLWYMKKPAS